VAIGGKLAVRTDNVTVEPWSATRLTSARTRRDKVLHQTMEDLALTKINVQQDWSVPRIKLRREGPFIGAAVQRRSPQEDRRATFGEVLAK
jgi:hypothetical protein